MNYPWHLYAMAIMYMIAGIFHFIKPKLYLRIMPRYLPIPKTLVYASGVVEIILGILILVEETRLMAIYGLVLMLAVFLLVHFYMLSSKKAAAGIPKWILLLRIPIQFLLMYWAILYKSI